MSELHPAVTLRLYTDRKCFGPGVAMLLRRIQILHSLRAAAMDMHMAYSKAWTILREAERGLGVKLLRSTTGGRGGGGAVLTAEAEELLRSYDACDRELKELGQRLFRQYFAAYAAGGTSQEAGPDDIIISECKIRK